MIIKIDARKIECLFDTVIISLKGNWNKLWRIIQNQLNIKG